MAKFTFKRDPKVTGPARGASRGRGADINLGGRLVGGIRAPHWSDEICEWKIMMRIRADGHPGWRYASLKARFPSYEAAQVYVTTNADRIQRSLDLLPETD